MSRASQAKMRPTAPAPGGADPNSPLAPHLAAIERAFAVEPKAAPDQAPLPEEFMAEAAPPAKLPFEAFLIGGFVAISFINAALQLYH